MSQFMTWGEFRRKVETAEVKDDTVIAEIAIRGNLAFQVTWNTQDQSVMITSPGLAALPSSSTRPRA